MPLHDHPNMSVFFRLVFGGLEYEAYDKLDCKFKYNDFSSCEYEEMLSEKRQVVAAKSHCMNLKGGAVMFVRPSSNNMHQFVATENSCFFDICLPNYQANGHTRRCTYYNELPSDTDTLTPQATQLLNHTLHNGRKTARPANSRLVQLEYDTTPPRLPTGLAINEVAYRGEFI